MINKIAQTKFKISSFKKMYDPYLVLSKQRTFLAWLFPAVNRSMNIFFNSDLPGDDLRISQASEVGL